MRAEWAFLALLTACGGGTAAAPQPVDEDRVARRAAEILFERLRGGTGEGRADRGTNGAEDEYARLAVEGTRGAGAALWPADADEPRLRVPIDGAPARGADEPLVTIVTFSDFECPFCSRVQPTLEQVLREYPDEVRLVFRHNPLPFHQNANPAAQTAIEAYRQGGDELFWRVHDALFANQRTLARADLVRLARAEGVRVPQLNAALDGSSHQSQIDSDQELTRRLDARGTPTFFLNGRKLTGAQPFDVFRDMIEEEIDNAEAALAAGVPRSGLYASVLAGAEEEAAAPAPRPPPDSAPGNADVVYQVPVGSSPTLGPADALVTIVQFTDFECPFCSRVRTTLRQIRDRYGSDVRIVFKMNPLPFHRNAGPAAIAALEAFQQRGVAGFEQMHDLLFDNQRDLARQDLERYARQTSLNMRRFKRALAGRAHQQTIDDDQALATRLGARGTPSFFINGHLVRGAQPLEAFTSIIDRELREARAMVDGGTSPRDVYAAIIRNGVADAGAAPNAPPPPPPTVYQIPVPRNAPSLGPTNAAVTIQLFTDFQCPFCNRLRPTLDQIRNHYGPRVRIVFRNYPLPFHTDAPLAHRAAMEVFRQGGNGKFWEYHDLVFENQRSLTRQNLERWARQVGGIDMARFRRALDTDDHQDTISADMDAIDDAGARIGTPSSFINGRLLQGAQPFDRFRVVIDAELP